MKEYENAITVLQAAQTKVADAFQGKTGNFKRCLFTNAFPQLGILTNTLHEVSSTFHELNGHYEDLKVTLSESINDLMNQLVASDPLDGKTTKRKMEKSADAFESKLISTLSNRKPLSASEVSELCDLRMESELARYDLVEKLNICNCSKKWLLSKVGQSVIMDTVCTYLLVFYMRLAVHIDGNFRGGDLERFRSQQREAVQRQDSGAQASDHHAG